MSKIGFVAILFLMMGKSYSQENYFVLIQADDSQPFYAVLEGKTFSSSPTGYLILSKLKDTTYLVAIGFPKDIFPREQFSITVNNADLRYQLKNQAGKGWGLFDPQSMTLKMPVKKEVSENIKAVEGVKKDDAFSRLMAGVVNDTAVMYTDFGVEQKRVENPVGVPALKQDTPQDIKSTMTEQSTQQLTLRADSSSRPVKEDSVLTNINNGLVKGDNSLVKKDSGLITGDSRSIAGDNGLIKGNSGLVNEDHGLAKRDSSAIKTDSSVVKLDNGIVKKDSVLSASGSPVQDSVSARPVLSVVSEDSSGGSTVKMGEPKIGKEVQAPKTINPFVEKLSEKRTSRLMKLVFVDHNKEGIRDTILIQIPIDSLPSVTSAGNNTKYRVLKGKNAGLAQGGGTRSGNSVSGPSLIKGQGLPPQKGNLGDSSAVSGYSAYKKRSGNTANSTTTVKSKKPVLVNSDCNNFASDEDVDKLRQKMMVAVSDQARIDLASKVFRSRCFTTSQVKTLSQLFMNDEGRFGYFRAAYPFVTDSDQFEGLVGLLSDSRFINRFKKMTGQQ